jgi:hypothetical protein
VLMQEPTPIIVQVVETPAESTSVGDVLIGSLGLTGALLLAALVLGGILGALLVGIKLLRARWNLEKDVDLQELRVTPGSQR